MRCADRPRPGAPARSGDGFTLIELLVVVVIIGIISAVVLLSLGLLRDDRGLTDEARRLSSLIELATDEASLQGRDYGLEFIRNGYRFVEYDPQRDQWNEVTEDELYRPRQLDDGAEFELFLEDREVELAARAAATEKDEKDEDRDQAMDDRDEDYLPHVLILSSGDVTPFNLTIVRPSDGAEVKLSMDVNGDLKVEADAEPTS